MTAFGNMQARQSLTTTEICKACLAIKGPLRVVASHAYIISIPADNGNGDHGNVFKSLIEGFSPLAPRWFHVQLSYLPLRAKPAH
jgi:hypothetical protein